MEVKEIKTIVDNLDNFIDVPSGISRLRNTVLDLAINGLLTEQKKEDGLAEELYKEIQTVIVNSGAKNAAVSEIKEEELLFSIPNNWKWVRLEEVFLVNPRNIVEDISEVSYIPMKTISSTWSVKPIPTENKLWGESKQGLTHVANNDVVLAKITPCFENLKSGVLQELTNGFGVATTEVHVFRQVEEKIIPEYLLAFLKSHSFVTEAIPKMTGTAGQKRVSTPYIKNQLFPLPPLAEQKRIVERVDELMKLIDQLEVEKKERDEVRGKMAVSAFYSFGTEHNEFALKHLSELVKTPSDIDELEKSILSLAVSGKLTLQNQAASTAEDLYNEIQKIKEKTEAKNNQPLQPLSEDKFPFEIPNNWKWTKLSEVTTKIGSGSTPRGGKSIYVEKGPAFVRSQNIYNDGMRLENIARLPHEVYESMSGVQVLPDDVLLNITGASIGRSSLVSEDLGEAVVSQHVTIIRPALVEMNKYLHLLIISSYFQRMVWERQVGVAREGLSKKVLEQFEIPLPPLEEQKRIVAKVNDLMIFVQKLREVIEV